MKKITGQEIFDVLREASQQVSDENIFKNLFPSTWEELTTHDQEHFRKMALKANLIISEFEVEA